MNFNVFPVGKAGAASLILLQKGRRGSQNFAGKNYIISISPTWFFKESVPVAYYDGNFSLLQAGELIYSREISFDLKPDVARRMLKYPKEVEKSFLLAFALRTTRLGFSDESGFLLRDCSVRTSGNGILRMQDHFEMLFYIWKDWGRLHAHVRRSPQLTDWNRLITDATAQVREHTDSDPEPIGPEQGSEMFAANEQHAHEWVDFELLLRGLNELGRDPYC